jgi:prepilin-type processing-associated H-X9-DG protein
MLVLVGVLAILAAFLFPIFARDHGSRRSSCQNNLKQIALGFKQYINDFDAHYPLFMVTSGSSKGVPPYGWADALQPYIKNTQVYQCPNDSNGDDADPTKPNYCDYWYNANFMVFYKGKWTGAPESILGSSSQTVIAGDGGNTTGAPTGDARYNQCGDGTSLTKFGQRCAPSPVGFATYPGAQIHLDGANFAYADGHVKWIRGSNPTQSANVLSNSMTQKTISESANSGKTTFSLLSK